MDKKTIAVIDDEVDLCSLMKSILEESGRYRIIQAHDGTEGETLCLKELPDLIFLDYVMPKEKGDKVIQFLRKNPQTQKIPIILMSGLGEMVYFEKQHQWKWLPNTQAVKDRGNMPDVLKWKRAPSEVSETFGVAAYLPKPFKKEVLLEVVETIMLKAQGASDVSSSTPQLE